jgi:hypothetical protein
VDAVRRIADAVLYEGHVLWPYRRSALKNRERWTFGRLHPQGHGEATTLQAQLLLETDRVARLDVTLRFLHLVERRVHRRTPAGMQPVDTLDVEGQRYLSWDEATERSIELHTQLPGAPAHESFDIPAGGEDEPLLDRHEALAGLLGRRWRALHGAIAVSGEVEEPGLVRVTVTVTNTTRWTREASPLASTLLAAHLVLIAGDGARWVSLTDAPRRWQPAAAACVNVGTWPVLVGEPGDRSTMLAAPIVLYDYPQIAPESPGDFFDATEIDQMLVLNVLGLTEEERREVAASDPRAREIVERCAALSKEDVLRLHGTLRDPRARGGA